MAAPRPPVSAPEAAPGEELGLPPAGRGSLAPWSRRVAALVLDWGLSMLVATGLLGPAVIRGHDWRQFGTYGVFFLEKAVFTALLGGSFGQVLARVAVVRLRGGALEWWRAALRTLLVCALIPAVVVGANRRGLDDLLLDTVVVNRR